MLQTSGLLEALVKWKISIYKAFTGEWRELTSWVTMLATDIQTIQDASKAGVATTFTCVDLCCHLNSEAVLAPSLTHCASHFGLGKQQL